MRILLLILTLTTASANAAILREDIGELKIHDLLIRPHFTLSEPSDGSFTLGESSFALRWELQEKYASVVRIGPRTLINPTARYEQVIDDEVSLVEAFAEYTDYFGRFRLGRMPVEFGYEGRLWERELIFPRSMLFANRAMMLRDVGGSYDIQFKKWFTGFTVHNGESDDDIDGRIWYTARWGYRYDELEIGLVGQTGGTKPTSTGTSTDTLAGVDPSRDAKWRIGGIYAAVTRKKLEWSLEYIMGARQQGEDTGKFVTGHADVGYQFSKTFSAHLRYDHFDPNTQIYGDLQRRASLGVVMSNRTRSSNLILVGTKVIEQVGSHANHELRLIWSLSHSGVVRF